MKVMIGIDPHKASHTAVAIRRDEDQIASVKVRATSRQVDQLMSWAERFEKRTWAIESAGGLGYLLAQQLVARGEQVLDVPATLASRTGVRPPSAPPSGPRGGRVDRSGPRRVQEEHCSRAEGEDRPRPGEDRGELRRPYRRGRTPSRQAGRTYAPKRGHGAWTPMASAEAWSSHPRPCGAIRRSTNGPSEGLARWRTLRSVVRTAGVLATEILGARSDPARFVGRLMLSDGLLSSRRRRSRATGSTLTSGRSALKNGRGSGSPRPMG